MAEIEVKHNLPDFKRQLAKFGFDFERKAIRSGVAAASRVFKNRTVAVLNRPRVSPVRRGEQPGTLRRAIYIKRARAPRGEEHYFVGVRQGKKARGRKGGSADAYYWRWVELGHRIRRPGQAIRGGRRTRALMRSRHDAAGGGRVQAYPFLKPAFNAAKQDALNKFNEMVQKRINQENAKRAA
jgi:HK97 gp10 family phage protein